jgi:hypothetical protein
VTQAAVTNSLPIPGALDQRAVRPAQEAAGIIRERCGRGERRPDERCTSRCPEAVADDIADDQDGGILGPLGQFQAGAPRQFGRGQRIADRAQILQLVLRRLKTLTQHGKILVAHRGFIAESRDQRVLAVLQVIPTMEVALLGRYFRAQPPKLLIVLMTLFAHTRSYTSNCSVCRGQLGPGGFLGAAGAETAA